MYKTYGNCLACGGSGIYRYIKNDTQGNPEEVIQDPCVTCNGLGYLETGTVDGENDIDWIKKKIKKILNKLEIPEEE
jgi:DnaJ-class molecular chaperone